MDYISSGSYQSGLCPAFRDEYHDMVHSDLETHALGFSSGKGRVRKKALKRIIVCKLVEFDDDDRINRLRKLLRSCNT